METPAVPVNPSAPTNTSGVATEATGGSIVATESVVERSQKGKEKVSEASAEPDSMEDRMMKRALKISRADQYKQPIIATPTGETSGRGSNQPLTSDVPVDDRTGSNTLPSIRVLEESARGQRLGSPMDSEAEYTKIGGNFGSPNSG
ncbi:hypothetical protein R1sor_019704 [Riccia sorocarpa]|uniref:Uncharacterized protein n=1 Tax=Riccia sorocarpa TaxID=122646 RepID=A0ABD3IHL2_9MARC